MTESAPRIDIAGRAVVLQYTDPVTEYNAFWHSAALVDRSQRHRLSLTGSGAADALNGLVTNDVAQLVPGRGQYAAALSPKGKIVADLRIFLRSDGSFLVDAPVRAAQGWMAIVRKYINPRTAKYKDESESLKDIGVFGPRASEIVSGVLSLDREALRARERHSIIDTQWLGESVSVVTTPDLGMDGFDLLASADVIARLQDKLIAAGCTNVGLAAWEIARIESGTPEWGLDMDESTLAQEANLDQLHAISYTKGCYTGQETVARIHFRGHVNRHLRALRFVSVDVPPPLSEVFGEEDRALGEVRSSAYSPRLGGVAIAMAGVHELPVTQPGA
jgi:tRNA-modifying protein YgfZ